jgi:hypothetical protein
MDTLHLSTAWFETDKRWRSFSDPSVVRVPIAESGITLSERRVQRGVTLAVVLVGIPVAAYILLWALYATTYNAAT